MVEGRKTRRDQELVELSRSWDTEAMLSNLQEEMRRMEEGLSHMVWDAEMRRVTRCPNPSPVTPKFETRESADELEVKVRLPRISKDNISLRVAQDRIEVFAKLEDRVCRPYFLSVDSDVPLNSASVRSTFSNGVLEVFVRKLKKVRVIVK